MARIRKYGVLIVMMVVGLFAVQASVSLVVRTHRIQEYLTVHLERAFGRPVQAGRFSVQILPVPELDVAEVTIGEDPGFGNEYFLRADHMTARLRWLGLLRGHFEFGTMSFSRPSLILVRNADGHWNLERWLPPAHPAILGASNNSTQSQPRAQSTYHLQKIDFDEGRISFKQGDEKRPFAFTEVSGSVEQVSPGRWQVQLEAQPWRSGVQLQSTGTLQVAGFVAGTSARLQPAQIRLHWGKVSLADLFRLITGNDSGVRGEFALDGKATIGMGASAENGAPGLWHFSLQARAEQIHRWDLTEREDNPRVKVDVKGLWDMPANEARAEEVRIDLPGSNLSGSAVLDTSGHADWHANFTDLAVQGKDLLAWYRAFQPNVTESVVFDDEITGSLTAAGWPLRFEDGSMEGSAGSLELAGLLAAHLAPFRGTVRNGKIQIDGVRVSLIAQDAEKKVQKISAKPRPNGAPENTVEADLTQDSASGQGSLRLNLHLADTAPVFQIAAAFGHPVNKGWEYSGSALGLLAWNWRHNLREAERSGSLELSKARLQVAGLNEPLKMDNAKLEWKDSMRNAVLEKVEAFGAGWSGTISEQPETVESTTDGANWRFQLHADHLDATELDRWIGPRSRPNWLQRLLSSLLGNSNSGRASELLRRVSAEGQLTADSLTIEKIKLTKAQATVSLNALHLNVRDAVAQWAGGNVHGGMQARFAPLPKYEVDADLDKVNLAQLPWSPRWGERWTGLGSGNVHLTTSGVGREDLLKQLAGSGTVRLNKIEFRGWDVELSAESGGPSAGASRWASGEGQFQLKEQTVRLDDFQLDTAHRRTQLAGTISFGMDGNLTFTPAARLSTTAQAPLARELRVSGQLENPQVTVFPVESEQARP
jgi:uncharacterized protein involved in outer membrane biogenesis